MAHVSVFPFGLILWKSKSLLCSSYRFTDKEVLCGGIREEVNEHVLQAGWQPALQLHLQTAVLSWVPSAGLTGETHFLWLVWQQPKQLVCSDRQTHVKEMMLIMILSIGQTTVYYILLCACHACINSIRIEIIERGSQTFISLFK